MDLAFSLEHNRYRAMISGALGERHASGPMLTWQKRARAGALVVVVGVVAVVFATTRRREDPPAPAPVNRVDPAAVVESSGAFLVQVKGERETVTIRANKQLTYPDGSTVFSSKGSSSAGKTSSRRAEAELEKTRRTSI